LVEDVGLEAERRRYARVTQPTLEPSIKAEQRRQETYRREKQRTQEMVETVVREQQIPPGVYQVGDKYVAVVPPAGPPQVMYREQYQGLTPEQMLGVGALSQEEYARYQRQKERAFLLWERTAYPEWAREYAQYEEAKARQEKLSGLITNINRLSMRLYGEWGIGEKGQPILLKPGLTYQLQELGLGVFELRATQDPFKAMKFALKMGYISEVEYGKWVGEMWEYQKLWEEDPNKALSFALGKRWITPEQYRESYLQPTFTEFLEIKARDFLKTFEKGPVGEMFKSGGPLVRGVIGAGIGVVGVIDPFIILAGVAAGQEWPYKLKPPPPGMMTVISAPFFGSEGLRWPQWGREEQKTLEKYLARIQEFPGIPVGEAYMFWMESKAIGWIGEQYWSGAKWGISKIIPEATKKALYYEVSLPTKVWFETTIRKPLDIAVHKSALYTELYLPTKATLGEWGYRIGALRWHLPSRIQSMFWPKEYAIRQIEAAFPWETSRLYWHTFGIPEQTYMVPFFTQQSLWMAMPTKEWAKLAYLESMYKRSFFDWTLSWTKGLYPAFGISPFEAGKLLSIEEMMAQAERVLVKIPEKTIYFSMVEGEPQLSLVTTGFYPTNKTTLWSYRTALEFEQSTKYMMPTRYLIPRSIEGGVADWVKSTWKGIGEWPKGKTFFDGALAMLEREAFIAPLLQAQFWGPQISRAPSYDYLERMFYIPPAYVGKKGAGWALGAGLVGLQGIFPKPKLALKPRLKHLPFELEKLMFKPIELAYQKGKKREETLPLLRVEPTAKPRKREKAFGLSISGVAQAQAVSQTQKQMQKQMQNLLQIQTQKLDIPTPRVPWPPELDIPWPDHGGRPPPPPPPPPFPFKFDWPREMRLPRGGGFWGGWFKRVHPIATPREVMQALGMAPARRVKRHVPKREAQKKKIHNRRIAKKVHGRKRGR